MSKRTVISLVVILLVIVSLVFWYFYSLNKIVTPSSVNSQSDVEKVAQQLDSYVPDPNNSKTPAQITKELDSYKPATGSPSETDILNSLNSFKQ